MKLKNSRILLLRQIDRKLSELYPLAALEVPSRGWISQIRKGLNLSLRQLGERLGISAQAVRELEKREADQTISLKSLKEAGRVLNLKLVYGFIPYNQSLENMVEHRAREIAFKIVKRTATTMALEDQSNSAERLHQAVEEMAQELKKEMPKTLWD